MHEEAPVKTTFVGHGGVLALSFRFISYISHCTMTTSAEYKDKGLVIA